MSIITNYWPDPRFANAGSFAQKNCSVEALPSNDGITITATNNSDPFVGMTVKVPANALLRLALKSENPDRLTLSDNCVANIWSSKSAWIATMTGDYADFTSPSDGLVEIRFRAPATVGKHVAVRNVFLGTSDDYATLLKFVPSGFCAGDLMDFAMTKF